MRVHAYELLSRSGVDNFFAGGDADQAASRVIADSALLLDLDDLVSGKRAFVNVTREVVLNGWVEIFPRDSLVVELLETIEPDEELVEACRRLREQGYAIALDDFVYREDLEPLIELAEIVKVDFLQSGTTERRETAERLRDRGVRLLAEKIETHEMLQEARQLGYSLFQGFFFSKPVIVSANDVPGYKLHVMEVLNEIYRPELDFEGMESVIKRDMALAYKLLRYINSAGFGLRQPVDSIRRALIFLGQNEIRKWATLMAMTTLGHDRPEALVPHAVTRGRFCETVARWFDLEPRSQDLFLMGVFSIIDAVLGRPLEEILNPLPVSEEIKRALTGESSPLSPAFDFCLDHERGDWEALDRRLPGVEEASVTRAYVDAVAWTNEILRAAAQAD